MTIGKFMQTERESAELKLREVAEALGVSIQFISNIEHGRAPLPAKYVPLIAGLFDADPMFVATLGVRATDCFKQFAQASEASAITPENG